MDEAFPRTTELRNYLHRMKSGDPVAREELFQRATGRLERLTQKMLKGFTGVQRWVEAGDVLQNALLRLLRALGEVQPNSVREFLALSAAQIRRELLDLVRHYYGPRGLGANHATQAGRDSSLPPLYDQPDRSQEEGTLEAWCEFHGQVQALPDEEREVVDLLFYQELPQAEAAALLQVTVRTVQRRWQAALVKLHQTLKGQWPGL
jgi:RNA polymerase sigma-70 factor (ECF subfamily)